MVGAEGQSNGGCYITEGQFAAGILSNSIAHIAQNGDHTVSNRTDIIQNNINFC